NADDPDPVSMKDGMDNGGLIYIGIASAVNDLVCEVLGSFLNKQLSILIADRSRVADKSTLRDTFVIPDEASQMEERVVVMNPIYTMAQGARVFVWPAAQSFAGWHPSTTEEIQSNARNFVVLSLPSRDSAADIASTVPDVFAMQRMAQEETRQKSFQGEAIGISGDTRLSIVTDAFLRPNIELAQVPRFHAHIWFKDAPIIPRGHWWGRQRVRKDD